MSCVHACIHWTMCPVARAHNEMHRVRRFTRGQSQLVPSPYSACNEYRSAIASPFHSAFVWSPSSTINYPSRRVAMSRSPRSQLYHSRGKTDSSRGQDYHFSDRSCTSLVSLRLIVSPCVSSCRGPRARIGRIKFVDRCFRSKRTDFITLRRLFSSFSEDLSVCILFFL